MAISPQDRARVKGEGFLTNRGTDLFSARIITENGVLSAAQLRNLSEVAQNYGNGQVAFTSRLTVELPGISFDDIPAVQAYVAKEGMVTGGTGSKVRPVVACKGTVCVFGLIDTQALAKEIHDRFYVGYRDVILPHKFKIAVGGCPNNCVKPDLNDLGIVGARMPAYASAQCRGCKTCGVQASCPMAAASLAEGKLAIDAEICNQCGRCVDQCPFGAVPGGEAGYKVYVGGRWGKQVRRGDLLGRIFTKEEVLDIVEKAILLFKREGEKGERFASMVERLGVRRVEKLLTSNILLRQKADILAVAGEGGATC
nr:4Fe-4S binding protein [Maliibacterium massiliense]